MFLITYDLNRPGQSYSGLWLRLEQLGACRVLLSAWVIPHANLTAVQIRDALRAHVDDNDRLLVAGMTREAAWLNVPQLNSLLK